MRLESLECRRLLAADNPIGLPLPPAESGGSVQGLKWEDLDGNGIRDPAEPGLAGVTIYADVNWNGRLDAGEPSVVTERDQPETDFDEAGLYRLQNVPAGEQLIREIVPPGFVQTYPAVIALPVGPGVADPGVADPGVADPGEDDAGDRFSLVEPPQLEVPFEPGMMLVESVAITIDPFCIRPYDIDVVASDPSVKFENLSGVQLNGCGGDTSQFDVAFGADEAPLKFEIQFIDTLSGFVLGSIPVFSISDPSAGGGHVVAIEPGGGVDGVDFGNVRRGRGAIEGRKWLDRDGNGQWDPGEQGLGGITIYADMNNNGRPDRGEPQTVTAFENPFTDFDEGGLYQLSGLPAGEYTVREIVSPEYVQTFPGPGASVVSSETGQINAGIAIDLDVTDVAAIRDTDGVSFGAELELTVVWPDSCGTLIDADTGYTTVGNTIVVELAGRQVGNACAEVISPQQTTLELSGLQAGRYQVVTTLHESISGGEQDFPTLTAVAEIVLGSSGAHRVALAQGQLVSDINFGNRWAAEPGSVDGLKWRDDNGDGVRGEGEPGLAGVTIYADLNFNGQLDGNDPSTVTRADDPATDVDETGEYRLDGIPVGTWRVREVVPDGFVQTFPNRDSRIDVVDSQNLPPGRALSFDLTDVQADPDANGVWGLVLTFEVVWPDGCGSLIDAGTTVNFDGVGVQVELQGTQVGNVCTQALVEQTVSIHVPDVGPGAYFVEGILRESDDPQGPIDDSFLLQAEFSVGGGGGGGGEHRVSLPSGGQITGIDFGNQRSRVVPPDGVLAAADLDQDGFLGAQDINLLAAAIRVNSPESDSFDLSGDGQLDSGDLEYLVQDLMKTHFGDSNLDGVFDSSDLVKVFQLGQYEDGIAGNSDWLGGDWNGDGDFTSSDLIFALQSGGYDQGPVAARVAPLAADAAMAWRTR